MGDKEIRVLTLHDDRADGLAPFHREDVVDDVALAASVLSEEVIPAFPELLWHRLVTHVSASIGNMLCSLLLVEQFGIPPRLTELRGQKSVALEEDCNGRICSEGVIDNPTLFKEHLGHVHRFAQLKRSCVEPTAFHDEGIHSIDHEFVLYISVESIGLRVSEMKALLENL
jgi:hypothetical protein